MGPGSKKYRMTSDPSVPAAQGTVEAKHDKANGNTEIDVKVFGLGSPAKLTPPADVYIVWVRPRDGNVEKEGVLRVGDGLKGELHATTTSKDCDVFITAEKSESVTEPTGIEILQTHVGG